MTEKTNFETNKPKKEEPKVMTGVLFGPPASQKNVLIVGGKKTGYLYVFKTGHKTFVHPDDAKAMEKEKMTKIE